MQFITVQGIKSTPIVQRPRGGHMSERAGYFAPGGEVNATQEIKFQQSFDVRPDKEPAKVILSKNARCQGIGYQHGLKAGSEVYDLGLNPRGMNHIYACPEHFKKLPTLEFVLHQLATNKYILECTATDDAGVVVYEKTRAK